MTLRIFNFVLSIIINLFAFIINLIVSVVPVVHMPSLTEATTRLHDFWDLIFRYVSWVANALCLTPLSINLIIDIFTLRFLAKPTITIIKMAFNWVAGAKDK